MKDTCERSPYQISDGRLCVRDVEIEFLVQTGFGSTE